MKQLLIILISLAAGSLAAAQNVNVTNPVSRPVPVNVVSTGALGVTDYFSESVSNTPIAVKATGGSVFGLNITNLNAAPVYLHFYNTAAGSVSVGTTGQATAPIAIPATGAFFVRNQGPAQYSFSTAITIAATTSPLSSVSTAPSTPLVVSITYQ